MNKSSYYFGIDVCLLRRHSTTKTKI